ncbi:Zinc finger swim domain-containing protein 7 [Plakobranchus ocellatus]|uniref:Zinc finger swim domain-containing protein 7 n=1 Tax=Plakobranchus ocellatus TaxID=259542 RepID=A0AAV4CCT0_9GAST|nr:Zinc finger swim domain-containing protein 7 [Plakobranchus ocellatus]
MKDAANRCFRAVKVLKTARVAGAVLREFLGCPQQLRAASQVIGASGTPYTCFPNLKYCSCPAYQFSVLRKESQLMCKHVLALKLAEAMEVVKPLPVSDAEITSMIAAMD